MGECLTTIPPVDPALAFNKAAKPTETLRISGRNKLAIDSMVWDGLKRSDAAEKAGLKDHALYVALTKPHVKAYYLRQLEVLRLSERARSVFRMTELRDQDDNKMVAFNAAKELAGSAEDTRQGAQAQSLPGLVVQINVGSGTRLTQPTATIIDNADGST
jgi:hypothetical protein